MGKNFGDARMPSLKDKIRDQEIERARAEKEALKVEEKPVKKPAVKK